MVLQAQIPNINRSRSNLNCYRRLAGEDPDLAVGAIAIGYSACLDSGDGALNSVTIGTRAINEHEGGVCIEQNNSIKQSSRRRSKTWCSYSRSIRCWFKFHSPVGDRGVRIGSKADFKTLQMIQE